MGDILGAIERLGAEFNLEARQIAYIILFLLVMFFLGKGGKYLLDRVQNILSMNDSIQKQLTANLQGAYVTIQEQQDYIIALRQSTTKLLEKIDALETRINKDEERIHRFKIYLIGKGLTDEANSL